MQLPCHTTLRRASRHLPIADQSDNGWHDPRNSPHHERNRRGNRQAIAKSTDETLTHSSRRPTLKLQPGAKNAQTQKKALDT